jgi:hypothetical protein
MWAKINPRLCHFGKITIDKDNADKPIILVDFKGTKAAANQRRSIPIVDRLRRFGGGCR